MAVTDLLSQGFLDADLECQPALVHQVAVDACASEHADTLAEGIRLVLPAESPSQYSRGLTTLDPGALWRLMRLDVYRNDVAEFRVNRRLADRAHGDKGTVMMLAAAFYDAPLETAWIASRHPEIQAPLLEAKLNSFIVSGLGGEEMPETIAFSRQQRDREGFGGLADQLLRYDLLAGRLDAVRDAAQTASDADARQSLEGAAAFLEGRNDAALLHYREALKLRRKRIGKRKLFLEQEHRVLFLLALLGANDPAVHGEIQTGLDAALDPWWNPAVEDQASDRAHRIGQERPVTIYRLVMQDSIEERILALHRDKRDLASELLDGAETAGRLSGEALLDLIRA